MSETEQNTDLIIGVSAGLAAAALVGILIGVAVACRRKILKKEAEEEKRYLEEDEESGSGSDVEHLPDPGGDRSRTISTQTPISKGTQTPTAVYATPSSKLGLQTGYGVRRPRPAAPNIHPITGLPHVTLRAKPPLSQQPPGIARRTSASSDPVRTNYKHPGISRGPQQTPRPASYGHVPTRPQTISHEPAGPSNRYQPPQQPEARRSRTSPQYEEHETKYVRDPPPGVHRSTENVNASRSGPNKQAAIKELQRNYPTRPIPKLTGIKTKEDDRKEQYVDNWLGDQSRTNSTTGEYGSAENMGDRTWNDRMRQTLVNLPPSSHSGSSEMIPRLDVRF